MFAKYRANQKLRSCVGLGLSERVSKAGRDPVVTAYPITGAVRECARCGGLELMVVSLWMSFYGFSIIGTVTCALPSMLQRLLCTRCRAGRMRSVCAVR